MTPDLPTGTVTFLFTDVKGSTKLLHEVGDRRYAELLAAHHRLLREVWARHGGVEVDTAGDAFFVAFGRASDALAAAEAAQAELETGPVRVRMGLHTGEPLLTETGYVGYDVHRAARIAAVAHGGQVVISRTTAELGGVPTHDLGEHRLKDLAEPQRLYQLGTGTFPPLRSLHQVHLPVQPAPLIGRERELAELASRVRERRVVTLTGPGGTGKTRLALQLAAEVAHDFPDGVWWISLAALRDPALVVPTIASSLGAGADLPAFIGDKRLLLLLDNLEQVIASAASLAELVAATSNLRLVITSRQPLRIAGECEVDIAPLPLESAVALFTERAGEVRQGLAAGPEIAEICRRLDCLPLALELAAARTRSLTAPALLERLDRRLTLLTGGRRDAPERQRTLRATIAWTYELLDDDERALFARLGVFEGGCSLDAAERLGGASLDVLESLVEKSLVRRSGERYFMLETIREFAVEQLDPNDDLRRRHAEWVRDLVERLEPDLTGPRQEVAIAAYRADFDNVRAAFGHASGEGSFELAARIAGASWYFLYVLARYLEGRRLLGLADVEGLSPAVRAKVLDGRSAMESMVGNDAFAIELSETALSIRRTLGEPRGIMRGLITAASARERGGDPTGAVLYEECVDLATREGDTWFQALALTNLGSVALIRNEALRAEQLLRAAGELWPGLGDRFTAVATQTNLAAALLLQGKRDAALAEYRAAVAVWRELDATEGLFWCAEGLALAAAAEAPDVAARIGGAVSRACEELGYTLPDQEEIWHQRWRSLVRERLDHDELARLEVEGRAMTLDEALDYALSSVH
ncbi:MAG: hypothetical protein QOH95_171 [Gaiellaceae bacterium]|nr:hypothetical protein [Gaiellaceae bacterium]